MTDNKGLPPDSWYHKWRGRVHSWVQRKGNSNIAGVVLFVPDLFVLLTRLIHDKRVPVLLKARLALAAAYVINPFDFIPEGLTGVIGLTDDAGVLALTLFWFANIKNIDPQILRDNWAGENDPLEVIHHLHQRIIENADTLFNRKIWTAIGSQFSKS